MSTNILAEILAKCFGVRPAAAGCRFRAAEALLGLPRARRRNVDQGKVLDDAPWDRGRLARKWRRSNAAAGLPHSKADRKPTAGTQLLPASVVYVIDGGASIARRWQE